MLALLLVAFSFDGVAAFTNNWAQLGQDLIGDGPSDNSFGFSMDMNKAGDKMAISTYTANGGTGKVEFYSFTGSTWDLTFSLFGESTTDNFGSWIDMNDAGDRIVVGASGGGTSGEGRAITFELVGTAWTQLGNAMIGLEPGSLLGSSVAMNGAGDRIAVGAKAGSTAGPNSGRVFAMEYSGVDWTPLGADFALLESAAEDKNAGVKMNRAGDRVLVHTFHSQALGTFTGEASMYQYNSSSLEWEQLGSVVPGNQADEYWGTSCDINAAGDIFVCGAGLNDAFGLVNAGVVRVYAFDDSAQDWVMLGSGIRNSKDNSRFGSYVGINDAGNRITVGARLAGSNDAGEISAYSFDGLSWSQMGSGTFGVPGENMGRDGAMNGDGDIIATSGIVGAGMVRTYAFDGPTPSSVPTVPPTSLPTAVPTAVPTVPPTAVPTAVPTAPSAVPSATPSAAPSAAPTATPSTAPSAGVTVPGTTYVPPAPEGDNRDGEGLCALLHATNIHNVDNRWTCKADVPNTPPCGDEQHAAWPGLTCSPTGRVEKLSWGFTDYFVMGHIPAEIRLLDRVKQLDFHHQLLKGPIQEELSNLPELELLDLGVNLFTGRLPASFRLLKDRGVDIRVRGNQLDKFYS